MPRGATLSARPRLGAALLNSVSRTALAVLSIGLGLGVALPGEARAGCPASVSPVQNTTYNLTCSSTTFGSGTDINAGSNAGVYGGTSEVWTVSNESSGTITGANGVVSAGPATVNNSGHIYGTGVYLNGILLNQGGTVNNYSGGIINGKYSDSKNGGGIAVYTDAGAVTNGGLIQSYGRRSAIYFAAGGMVTNTGTIQSVDNGYDAVHIRGGAGTVTNNSGTISAGINGAGVQLDSGGTVTNGTATNHSATITGGDAGVYVTAGTGHVYNHGIISGFGTNGDGVALFGGGTVNNYAGATIAGAKVAGGKSFGVIIKGGFGTVTNAGTIQSYETHSAISINAGGTVTNNGGTIKSSGGDGVYLTGGVAATNMVTNSGLISGGNDGVLLESGGTVTNTSTITGADGVVLESGGTVKNNGGTITGNGGIGVDINGGLGTVMNSGMIHGYGVGYSGVRLGAGGSVTNSGTITGNHSGVYLADGGTVSNNGGSITGGAFGVHTAGAAAAMVTNAGLISGTASVEFGGSGANTLTLVTGSTLGGDAIGSTAAGATNALILQGQGMANNNFVNFNTLNVQAGGTWTLGGSSTFGDAMVTSGTLAATGTLNSSTLEIETAGKLIDTGTVTVTGSVTNAGALTISGATMHVVSAGGTFTQTGGTTTLLNGGVLDPANVNISGGVFGGSGGVVGNVSVTGGEIKTGAAPGGSLTVEGDYSQTGGEIVFDIDPNGMGGFLETTLVLDPSDPISISDTTFVFDFLNYTTASEFIADGLFNLNAFLGLAGGGEFCTELNCANVLQDVSFSSENAIISGFDPATGAISARAVPEPGTWALMILGFLGLGGLALRRRKLAEAS